MDHHHAFAQGLGVLLPLPNGGRDQRIGIGHGDQHMGVTRPGPALSVQRCLTLVFETDIRALPSVEELGEHLQRAVRENVFDEHRLAPTRMRADQIRMETFVAQLDQHPGDRLAIQ